ncbi:MAG: hypothetical protein QOG53_107 [Frankiales bacterium]|nr:hypothetical protein [Frankiales bacterium]
MTATVDDSTLADIQDPTTNKPSRLGRRIAVGVIMLIVVVGATGFLGVHAGTAKKTANGYTLTVVYPQIARAGLDVPWRATVTHPGGFPSDITIAISTHYFDIFETQGFHPNPSDESATPEFYYLTFKKPPGDTLEVSYDAYIQPGSQLGRHADTAVLINNAEMVRVDYRTWLMP